MRSEQGGFTLTEAMIVTVIAIPILLAILSTSNRLGSTVNTSERKADAADAAARVGERLGRMIRAGHHTTFKTRATAGDVTLGRAANVGDWFDVPDLETRTTLQFESASGQQSLNAQERTSPRELEVVLDKAETANSLDDDGDGLVDEGTLYLTYETRKIRIADGVESCTFKLDGQAVRFAVKCAKRDRSGNVHRAATQDVWWIRNP